jgi:hypothetical protein
VTLKQASCCQFPAVATAIGVEVREGVIGVEGGLDFRGTLGVSKEVPVEFRHMRLHFDLKTDASEEQLTTLIRLTERYCVVYQTLRQSPAIDVWHSLTTSMPDARP